ncbi:MAG TPA: glycerophosphodiester phosphodiesterase [Vicinamibacterales bacterium]|nr:glycerophosphodiester phosphodiesterase [Vicinamibacterales bacterium]
MRHPFFESKGPLVFAHRGGSALAPENTIAAFDSGIALGADGIELDVHLSRDGVVVVHHDATLDRTTDLSGRLAARTWDELSRADAGCRFAKDGGHPFARKGIAVPALDDVLQRYRDQRVIIELKADTVQLAEAVVATVKRRDAVERVCLGSFGRRALRAVRALEPSMATSAAREEVRWALYRSWCRWPVTSPRYGGYQIPELSGTTRVVSRNFVDRAHRAGLGVQVWTIDDERAARRLLDWGVDALITDRPDVIVPIVRSSRSPS